MPPVLQHLQFSLWRA